MARQLSVAARDKLQGEICKLFDEEKSSAEIAALLNVSRQYVYGVCEKNGRSFQARLQHDAAAKRKLVIASWLDGVSVRQIATMHNVCRQCVYDMIDRERQIEASQVPAWVPNSLHDQYRSIAYERGEPDAAAWARSVKKMAA